MDSPEMQATFGKRHRMKINKTNSQNTENSNLRCEGGDAHCAKKQQKKPPVSTRHTCVLVPIKDLYFSIGLCHGRFCFQ